MDLLTVLSDFTNLSNLSPVNLRIIRDNKYVLIFHHLIFTFKKNIYSLFFWTARVQIQAIRGSNQTT